MTKKNRLVLGGLALLFSIFHLPSLSAAPPIPATYTALYTELQSTDLIPFEQTYLNNLKLPNPRNIAYGAQLNPSSSSNGPGLLNPNNEAAVYQWLSTEKALGTQQVTVHVDFPILEPDFYFRLSQDQADRQAGMAQYQQTVAYYANLATWARSFGFKVVVESQNLFPDASTPPSAAALLWGGSATASAAATLSAYYNAKYQANTDNPNYAAYSADRGSHAATVARTMTPDYLSVIYEPDTEADNAGLPNLDSFSGCLANLQGIVSSYRASKPAVPSSTQLGAGTGVWLTYYDPVAKKNYQAIDFDQSFVSTLGTTDGANPLKLAFVDMHIYDVTNNASHNYLGMAWSIAEWMAGVPSASLAMSEVWLAKASANDVAEHNGLPTYRNTYSFWMPLDNEFLTDMFTFTDYWQFAFVSPSYPQFWSANLDYSGQVAAWDQQVPPNEAAINNDSTQQTTAALNLGATTTLGADFYGLLVSADTKAPGAPKNLSATGAVGSAYLNWSAASDNTGVLFYEIYRDGAPAQPGTADQSNAWFIPAGASAPEPYYLDSGPPAGTHTYSVYAVDMAGNVSAPAVVTGVKTY